MQLASAVKISRPAIKTFVASLKPEVAAKLSLRPTSLPVRFPLAFPSQLHEINIQTTLAVLRPRFDKYAAALRARRNGTGASSGDTVLRGVMGMYLGSTSEVWDKKNLLGAVGMRNLSEDQIAEYFDCPVMVEREHETMKGVTVGERGGQLLELVQEVKEVFKHIGSSGVECAGAAVEQVTRIHGDETIEEKTTEVVFLLAARCLWLMKCRCCLHWRGLLEQLSAPLVSFSLIIQCSIS